MMKIYWTTAYALCLFLVGCQVETTTTYIDSSNNTLEEYFLHEGRDDITSAGIKMIPIETPSGTFNVWTRRIGNNPDIKVLILHGGPGGTHEYLQVFDSYFPGAAIEYYHYDQLGSHYSDQPDDPSLWKTERFVEEVEQVRKVLGLNKDNFYIVGHSWGGILGVEYALKYQEHLKGLVISNMMMSIPAYNLYAQDVLGPGLGEDIFAEISAFEAAADYSNERYIEVIHENHYPKHVLRKPWKDWPEPVLRSFSHFNMDVYVPMQGPSEFGVAGDAYIKDWDRTPDLHKIGVPVLCIGAEYDTMDPEHMKEVSGLFPNGSYLHCPNGSHLAAYDDSEIYFDGLIDWIKDVNTGS